VLLSEGTLPVPAERVGQMILVKTREASASRRAWWGIRGCQRMISAGICAGRWPGWAVGRAVEVAAV